MPDRAHAWPRRWLQIAGPLLALSLCACGGGGGPETSTPPVSTPVTPPTTPPVTVPPPATAPAHYVLTWADEFDTPGQPDARKWVADTGRNRAGWYNNELQYYSAGRLENAEVRDGRLLAEMGWPTFSRGKGCSPPRRSLPSTVPSPISAPARPDRRRAPRR